MELLAGLGVLAIIILIGFGTFSFIFWICMMVSVFINKGLSETKRWVWFGLMLGLEFLYGMGFIVAIVYFFTDRKNVKM